MTDNGKADAPLIENQRLPPRWAVVVSMNEAGGVNVAINCPSPDIAEMLLYRGLKFLERELTVQRQRREADQAPRITPASHFPKMGPLTG